MMFKTLICYLLKYNKFAQKVKIIVYFSFNSKTIKSGFDGMKLISIETDVQI